MRLQGSTFIISDISTYQSGYLPVQFQENNNQCLANYTVVSASIIDDSASKGITCSRKDSTATGTWTLDGVEVDCSNTTGPVRCTRQQSGSVTLYTAGPMSVVVMMQQYQKATTHVVLIDCVLVSDYGSLLQCQTCYATLSE